MRDRNLDDIVRGIIPPINLNQIEIVTENGYVVAFATWAFMSKGKADIFLEGKYIMQSEDWSSGTVPVFMDFVSPFGHSLQLYRKCREKFPKLDAARWRRHMKKKRVGVKLYNGV